MKKYNHRVNLSFEVASNSYAPSVKEIKDGLKRRLRILDMEESYMKETDHTDDYGLGYNVKVYISDTFLFHSKQTYETWKSQGKKSPKKEKAPKQLEPKLDFNNSWAVICAFMTSGGKYYQQLISSQMWMVYCKGDGFGKRTPQELEKVNGGWDWSHIRDSSEEAVIEMAQTICSFPNASTLIQSDTNLKQIFSE